jgi:hypothetical protein
MDSIDLDAGCVDVCVATYSMISFRQASLHCLVGEKDGCDGRWHSRYNMVTNHIYSIHTMSQ